MTRASLRAIPALLGVLTAALLTLALFTGPAHATEGGEGETAATEESGGFGTGTWDGMILAAGVGLVIGLVVYASSEPGGIHKAADH